MDLRWLSKVDASVFVNYCGPLFSFAFVTGKSWLIHRHCILAPEADWRGCSLDDVPRSSKMTEPVARGPFIVVRDVTARESPSSYSSVSGNGDSDTGNGDSRSQNNNNNGNGVAWIFSELELAVEASPPYIIVDSLYAEEISKNFYRGNVMRIFSVVGSLTSGALAFSVRTLPMAVPIITMTVVTASFYGVCYMKDPSMRYIVLGRKWRLDGVQLSPEHFLYTDQQPPLVLKAANSRFRKVLRVMPVILPVISTGIVLWRVWKVLS